MSISFNAIPLDLRTPGQFVEFDSSRAVSGPQAQPQRVLVIGQKLAAGVAPANVPIRITQADQAIQKFGRGSMLAAMCAAFLANNPVAETWALPMADNGAGVAATKTITVTGPATAAGTLSLLIAGQKVEVGVADEDTATEVATAIAARVAALPDLPVTAASAAGVVTLTARHKGVAGNDIDVRVNYRTGEVTPAGLAIAIAAVTAGTGNPDVTAAFTAIGDDWYNTFVLPWTDDGNLDVVEAELADRFGPLRMIDGLAFTHAEDTYGDLATLGGARNSPHVSIGGLKGCPTPPWIVAAAYAGVVSYHGAIDPARPFQGLVLQGVLAPAVGDRFTREERDLLLRDGISTFTIDAGGNVAVERPITTHQTNAFGLPDVAYLDVNTLLTLSYLRWSTRARIGTKYGRHKLAADGTLYGAGQAVVTPKVIRAELISLFREWEEIGLVEDIEAFKRDLIVERDAGDVNRLNALLPPNLVNQFRVFAAQVQFRL
jgi:phage tail sheath gpL-like